MRQEKIDPPPAGKKSRVRFLLPLLNAAGSVSALVGMGYLFIKGTSELPTTILASFVCAFLAVAWVLLLVQESLHGWDTRRQERRYVEDVRRLSRQTGYAKAMENIHQAYHTLRDTYHRFHDYEPGENQERNRNFEHAIWEGIGSSLNRFASAFMLTTGSQCRVCIKELLVEGTDTEGNNMRTLYAETLVRSHSNIEPQKDERHWITENTALKQIMTDLRTNSGCRHFFSNDLPTEYQRNQYRNSRWDDARMEREGYPYSSTIVWPICKSFFNFPSQHDEKKREMNYDCLGFLCIDSKDCGAFQQEFDVPLGSGYADVLYVLLKCFRQIKSHGGKVVEKKEA